MTQEKTATQEKAATQEKTATAPKPKRGAKKPRLTTVEQLTDEDMQALRLTDGDTAEFGHLREQVARSRETIQALESEGAELDDERLDRLSAAHARMATDTTAMVHFLAPRVRKLREGEAKRKWRSLVAKVQKDSKAA